MISTSFKHLVAATAHVHRLVRAQLVIEGGLAHAQTQILGSARLAGLLMFRSFRVDSSALAPGMRLCSEEAVRHGARLRDMLLGTLRQLGHELSLDALDERCNTASLSRLAFVEVHERLTQPMLAYLERSPMNMQDAAMAAAAASAGLIHDHAPAMAPRQAAALACFGFEEGLTTVPWPLGPSWTQSLPSLLTDPLGGPMHAHIRTMS